MMPIFGVRMVGLIVNARPHDFVHGEGRAS